MAAFADLEGRRATDRKRCRSCGAPALDGVIRIEARSYGSVDPRQPLKGGKVLASRSLSMCEACIVKRYISAENALCKNEAEDDGT